MALQRLGDAGGNISLARTPTLFPPDFKTGMKTPRSLYTQPALDVFVLCLMRVLLFVTVRVIT